MRVTIAVVWTLALVACAGAGRAQEASAVAVLVEGAVDSRAQTLASMLEARLSQDQRIRLLERTEVRRMLEEQRLSLAGLAERDNAIKAGQLGRVRAFVLLSAESAPGPGQGPGSVLIRVRVAETAHGLRLWEGYEPSEGSETETVAQRVAGKVTAALNQLTLPAGQVVPIGIIDIHRVQLGDGYDLLTRALPRLLAARLSTEPRLVVLERENLGLLLKEKQLTEGEDPAFWDSGILIDGVLRPAAGRGLEIALRWRRAGREGTIIAPLDPNAPARATDTAATALIQAAVETSSLARWEPEKEADEFFQQGRLLSVNQRYKDAVTRLETAHALQPQSVPYLQAVLANEWNARFHDAGGYHFEGTGVSFYPDLELAEIVSRLVRQMRDGYEEGRVPAMEVLNSLGGMPVFQDSLWGYFTSSVSTATGPIRGTNRENRAIWMGVVHKILQKAPNEPGGVSRMSPAIRAKPIEAAWVSSDVPQEILANVRAVFTQSLNTPVEENLRYSDWKHWLELSPVEPWSVGSETKRVYLGDKTQECRKLWLEYLKELTEADDPAVRFLSAHTILRCLSYDPRHADPELIEQWRRRTISIVRNDLKTPNEPFRDTFKWDVRREIRGYLTLAEFEEICEPLIAGADAANLAWWNPAGMPLPLYDPARPAALVTIVSDPRVAPESIRRFYQTLGRIAPILQKAPRGPQMTLPLSAQTDVALNQVLDLRSKMKAKYPEVDGSAPLASLPVRMLVRAKDWPHEMKPWGPANGDSFNIRIQLQNTMLWIAFLEYPHSPDIPLGLAGIDLQNKKCAVLCQTEVPYTPIHPLWRLVGLEAGENTALVAHNGIGIVALLQERTQGKQFLTKPTILSPEQGLPSKAIMSMASDGRALWVAYGGPQEECGLGRYDPQTRHWDTVFCSTVKGDPPFNSGCPYIIYALMPVDPGRLFFLVKEPQQGKGIGAKVPEGLWKMASRTHAVEYLGYLWNPLPWDMNVECLADRLWFKSPHHWLEFDLASEQTAVICGSPMMLARFYPADRNDSLHLEERLFIPRSAAEQLTVGYATFDIASSAIHNDRLWARCGDSRIMVLHKGQGLEQAETFENNILDGQPVRRFVSTPFGLVAIGDGVVGWMEGGGPPEARGSEAAQPASRDALDHAPAPAQAIWAERDLLLRDIRRHDRLSALTVIEQLVARYGQDEHLASVLREIAGQYHKMALCSQSRLISQYILDHYPDSEQCLWAQRDLVLSDLRLHYLDAAEADTQRLLSRFAQRPEAAGVISEVAQAYGRMGRHERARDLYGFNLTTYPTRDDTVWSLKGLVTESVALNDEAGIRTGLQRLLTEYSSRKNLPAAAVQIGRVLVGADRPQASELFQYVIDKHPDDEQVLLAKVCLGHIHLRQGRDDQAEALYQQILTEYANHPKLAEAVNVMGEGYFDRAVALEKTHATPAGSLKPVPMVRDTKPTGAVRENYLRAIGKWQIVARKLPPIPDQTARAWYFTGVVYRRHLREPENALPCYVKVVETWPDYEFAWSAQARIADCYEELVHAGKITQQEAQPKIEQARKLAAERYPEHPVVTSPQEW